MPTPTTIKTPQQPGAIGRFVRGAAVALVSAGYFAFVFQAHTPLPYNSGLGDWIDPYLINVLLEHWYRSLLTLSDPASLPMYFPASGTLGYSSSLILFALFYVPLRFFLHPFQTYTLALFLILEVGSV